MKTHRAFRYALASQACLLIGILLCIIIRPKWAATNYPISYFGNFRATIAPYAVSFLLSSYWLALTALALPPAMRLIRRLLLAITICALGVLCSPYMINPRVGWAHFSFAGTLLILELTLSMLLIIRSHHLYALLGFLVELVGAVLSVLSQAGRLHVELIGEVSVIIGFGLLLSYNLSLLDSGTPPPVESAK
jgi:hypothetical protein